MSSCVEVGFTTSRCGLWTPIELGRRTESTEWRRLKAMTQDRILLSPHPCDRRPQTRKARRLSPGVGIRELDLTGLVDSLPNFLPRNLSRPDF